MEIVAARAKAMNKSVSWYFAELAARDVADGQPLPTWWEPDAPEQLDLLDREAS